MKILILGATGFIGNAVFHALVSTHEVIAASRNPIAGYPHWKKVDFDQPIDPKSLLKNIDLVINAIGISKGDFKKIQSEIPLQLFKYCKEQNIKIINISAIGAENKIPATEFLRSKKICDDFVLNQTDGKVIYPGIVLGEGAESSQLFKELSDMPVALLMGKQKLPLVHIHQLTEIIQQSIENYASAPKQQFVVAQPETLKELFAALKGRSIKSINIPMALMAGLFKILPKFRLGVFDKNMFTLLNVIKAEEYEPLKEKATDYLKNHAIKPSNHILKLLILLSISFIWIWSGIISLYSWGESLNLMAAINITNDLAPIAIIAGSLADMFLGLVVWFERHRKWVLGLQVLFIVVYTLILTFWAPEFWLHPFGPIAKNIPLLALIYVLYKWDTK